MPEPVPPITAVVLPGSARNVTSRRTGASAPGYANAALRNSRVTGVARVRTGRAGVGSDDSVSSTSRIRSAHTAARGAIIATNDVIITAMRICMM